MHRVIVVAGEALIDMLVAPDGRSTAIPGGGPFNTARTIARLGQPAAFIGRISTDPFGALLAFGVTALLERYSETTVKAQQLAESSRRDLGDSTSLSRVLLVLLGAFFAFGQIVPIWLGARLLDESGESDESDDADIEVPTTPVF